MLTGSKINTGVEPIHVVFLNLQMRKIYTVLYITYVQRKVFTDGFLKSEKSLTSGGGHQCKVQTSLHSRPMLKIDCTISHKLLTPPLPQAFPSQTHISTCDRISTRRRRRQNIRCLLHLIQLEYCLGQ